MKTKFLQGFGAAVLLLALHAAAFAQGWTVLPAPTAANLTSVDFTSGQNGVAVGAARTILRTTDGGATWTAVNAGEGAQLNAVSFATDSAAVATGLDGQILFTQSAGAAWTVIQEGWMIDYHCAQQLTPMLGVLMGMNTIMQPFGSRTTNGWQSHDNFNFYVQHDASGNEGAVYGVHFFNADTGCAAVHVWDGHGAVVKTTDAGASWTTTFWTDYSAYAIDFPTPTIGYICGAQGMMAKSTNAGDSWELMSAQMPNLYGIKFINADTGWVVGENGVIGRTNDGGATGHEQSSGVNTTLWSVDFVNADTGYAVGDNGVILKTTTGGEAGNQPPGEFTRVNPPDSSAQHCNEEALRCIQFAWTTAHDADGDSVRYLISISSLGDTLHFATRDTVFSDSLSDLVDFGRFELDINWQVWATDGHDTVEAANGAGFFYAYLPDAAGEPSTALPVKYALTAYPNPFNPTTTLAISLPQAGTARLSVYSIDGRKVLEQPLGVLSAGEHRVPFDGSNLPSGVYLSRLETPYGQLSGKLVLMK